VDDQLLVGIQSRVDTGYAQRAVFQEFQATFAAIKERIHQRGEENITTLCAEVPYKVSVCPNRHWLPDYIPPPQKLHRGAQSTEPELNLTIEFAQQVEQYRLDHLHIRSVCMSTTIADAQRARMRWPWQRLLHNGLPKLVGKAIGENLRIGRERADG